MKKLIILLSLLFCLACQQEPQQVPDQITIAEPCLDSFTIDQFSYRKSEYRDQTQQFIRGLEFDIGYSVQKDCQAQELSIVLTLPKEIQDAFGFVTMGHQLNKDSLGKVTFSMGKVGASEEMLDSILPINDPILLQIVSKEQGEKPLWTQTIYPIFIK